MPDLFFFRTTVRLAQSELPENNPGQEPQDDGNNDASSESDSSSSSEEDEV